MTTQQTHPLPDLNEVSHHPVVKVLSAQVGVPSRGLDLKDALVNGQQADVKGAAAQVKDQDIALTLAALHERGPMSSTRKE